jgi:radical SAM protein with 4Fe4S-binding SPASM domain
MISVSRLLCNGIGPGDYLRYGSEIEQTPTRELRPIVVWNCTRRCNLNCIHCYANASEKNPGGEMNTDEGKDFILQLAEFGVPVLLFSGGEPLVRADFFELARYASDRGLGIVLSTNGTLINKERAAEIRQIGFREVGISLDGIGDKNDLFRGKEGAYEAALDGIRRCIAAGQRVSLRMTLTQSNYHEVPSILDLVENEKIDRVCFYHLAYAGRGDDLRDIDLSHEETRRVVDLICERTLDFYSRGLRKEVLLVGNHADGVYIYLKSKEQDPTRAEEVLSLLRRNGGNNSGIRIAAVDDSGNVHPDQFWWTVTMGNVKRQKFGSIWTDTSNEITRGLKDRKALLKGRCARCSYIDMCNGNLRARAEAVFGDMWQEDPACYLTDEEIGALS